MCTGKLSGGGTSVKVARQMLIEAHGLDQRSGFSILKQRVLDMAGNPFTWCCRMRPITTSWSATCGGDRVASRQRGPVSGYRDTRQRGYFVPERA
jgi:hypothetical protein